MLHIFPYNAAFSSSPSFVRQEVKDGADDWYFYNIYGVEKNGKQYTDDTIYNMTRNLVGNIQSVSYQSDGRTLNITFWLDRPFFNTSSYNHSPPVGHKPAYYVYIDADSDSRTGWNGIDYVNTFAWNDTSKRWTSAFTEISDSGYRLIKETNYKQTGNNDRHILITTDLGEMMYPPQYRIVFVGVDMIYDNSIKTYRKLTDLVNTIHIPTPKFTITFSPSTIQITRGKQNSTEIMTKSIYPISSVQNLQPQIRFYSENKNINGIFPKFQPNSIFVSTDGSAISNLLINASQNAHTSTLPIHANISFPSEFFGNPGAIATETSYLTIFIQDPISPMKQIQNTFSSLTTPLVAFATIVSIITGLGGLVGLRKFRSRKNKDKVDGKPPSGVQ
ncbi:MAG TPA: hypothetical protein VH500_16535 [Nitrososphaeraceae archaeon]